MMLAVIKNQEIITLSYPFPTNNPTEGLQEDGNYVLYLENGTGELTPKEFIEQRYWDGSSLQVRSPPPSPFCSWSNATWVVDTVNYLREIRYQRELLLYKSDWTQLADAPLTVEQKEEARVYRQALRDITIPIEQNPSAYVNIEDAPWPTTPTFLA